MKRTALLLIFAASVAHGEIYTWTDSRGAAHYTNRKDEIPVRYRPGARSLNYGDETRAGASQEQNVLQQSPPSPVSAPASNATGPVQVKAPSRDQNAEQLKKRREDRRERMRAKSREGSEQDE